MDRPIKKAVLDLTENKLGLQMISLVEDPAIQVHWITMAAQKSFQLAIQSEEQRIFFTPVLIPGQKILRNINGEEFDLVFDEETILQTQLKWTQDNLSSTVDIDHSQKLIPGVTFFESVILNANRFPEAKGFEGLPLGTWMLTGKVNSDEVWLKMKNKEINGVSIDGLFKTMNVQAEKHELPSYSEEEIQNILSHL